MYGSNSSILKNGFKKYLSGYTEETGLMVGSSKFGRRGQYPLSSLDQVDTIITDNGTDGNVVKVCEEKRVSTSVF